MRINRCFHNASDFGCNEVTCFEMLLADSMSPSLTANESQMMDAFSVRQPTHIRDFIAK